MRTHHFINECFYHVFSRGVEKRNIFADDDDYLHFVHCLYALNDRHPKIDSRLRNAQNDDHTSRERLVDIVSWCLMPNHFHLLLRQRIDGGVTFFMRKLGIGHAMYFNKKYERNGVLFQGRFKSVPVGRDEYLLHVIRYIHLNPVDLIESGWKEQGIKHWYAVNQFLESYRWSSYRDWIGQKNFPSLLGHTVAQEMFFGSDDHRSFVQAWLAGDRERITSLLFE